MSDNFPLKFRSKLYQFSQKLKALNGSFGQEENRFFIRAVFFAKTLETFWRQSGIFFEILPFKTNSSQIYALGL